MNGVQVSGSPFKVTVVAGPTRGANSTVTGTGLSLATAGKIASFTVQARDREANPAADEIESQGVESGAEESEEEDDKQFTNISFNGTLSRMMDHDSVGGGDRDNSTTFYASTKYLGETEEEWSIMHDLRSSTLLTRTLTAMSPIRPATRTRCTYRPYHQQPRNAT